MSNFDKEKAEAEAWFRQTHPDSYPYEETIKFDMEVDAFVLGAKWQASQPIVITDEMVIAALNAYQDRIRLGTKLGDWGSIKIAKMRAALEAALGVSNE